MTSLVEIIYRQHTDVVAENFKSFLENETYIDLVFVCAKNRKVGAHQIVMGCLSKFLSSLLVQNQIDTKEKVIHIYVPDIRAKIMRHILQFVYTGKAIVNREDLGEFNDDLILLGMPLSALSSVDRGQPNTAPTGNPNQMAPMTTTVPVFQPNEVMQNIHIPSQHIHIPTSQSMNIPTSSTDPSFAISNVESLSNPTFNSPNTYSNVMNSPRFFNQPDQMMPSMNTSCSNTPGIATTPQTSSGARISAEVITGSNKSTSTPTSTSKTPNQKSTVKSEPKTEKRRLPVSGGARKSLKFDQQCIDLIESDDDSDVISIT